jgi:hypothetical protein
LPLREHAEARGGRERQHHDSEGREDTRSYRPAPTSRVSHRPSSLLRAR